MIRLATERDLARLVELMTQLDPDGTREQLTDPLPPSYATALRAVLADTNQQLLVIEADGVVLGTMTLLIVPNISHQGRPYAIAENVVVDASARGAGLGEQLMRHAMDLARAAGCYKLALTSNKRRVDAHRFYERIGFQLTHEGFRIEFP